MKDQDLFEGLDFMKLKNLLPLRHQIFLNLGSLLITFS